MSKFIQSRKKNIYKLRKKNRVKFSHSSMLLLCRKRDILLIYKAYCSFLYKCKYFSIKFLSKFSTNTYCFFFYIEEIPFSGFIFLALSNKDYCDVFLPFWCQNVVASYSAKKSCWYERNENIFICHSLTTSSNITTVIQFQAAC